MSIQTRTFLRRSVWQVTMSHNLRFWEQLVKIGKQIRDTLLLRISHRIAWLAMLIQATLIADTDGAPIIRNTMRTDLQHFPMLANPSILTDIEVIANATKAAS